ncbi:hypothetical protein TNCV_1507741 [Trichonephila clavipes]|nr:hypothetical protein TNCV_1507741 [Trichonephila clavipes]
MVMNSGLVSREFATEDPPCSVGLMPLKSSVVQSPHFDVVYNLGEWGVISVVFVEGESPPVGVIFWIGSVVLTTWPWFKNT